MRYQSAFVSSSAMAGLPAPFARSSSIEVTTGHYPFAQARRSASASERSRPRRERDRREPPGYVGWTRRAACRFVVNRVAYQGAARAATCLGYLREPATGVSEASGSTAAYRLAYSWHGPARVRHHSWRERHD